MEERLIIDIGFNEYIMHQVQWPTRLYKGAGGVGKKDLMEWMDELDVIHHSKDSKEDLINKLIESGMQPVDFYKRFKDRAFGVHPVEYMKRFKLTAKKVRKMKDDGFLKVAYILKTRLYSKEMEIPMYDLDQYLKLTNEDMEGYINDKN